MNAIVIRHGSASDERGHDASQRPEPAAVGVSVSRAIMLIMVSLPLAYGGSAARAGEDAAIAAAPAAAAAPISLAGRWSGHHQSYSMRAPADESCGGKPCTLTFDIVACGSEWCGIRVTDDKPCGDIAMRLTLDGKHPQKSAFTGKLEPAKGAAPFFVEAWYRAPGDGAGEGSDQARLNVVGDTGGEMLMMRRSYPFHAQMARTGDATCTLEKATS